MLAEHADALEQGVTGVPAAQLAGQDALLARRAPPRDLPALDQRNLPKPPRCAEPAPAPATIRLQRFRLDGRVGGGDRRVGGDGRRVRARASRPRARASCWRRGALDRLEALAAEIAAAGGEALAVACDVAREADVDALVAETAWRASAASTCS